MDYETIIEQSKLSKTSKQQYIKKLRVIDEWGDINEFISHPALFLEKLNEYIDDGKLGDHSKESFVAPMKFIMKSENIEISEEWTQIHDSIRKSIEAKYLERAPNDKQKAGYIPLEELERICDDMPMSKEKLLLAMYIWIPPNRADYGALIISSDEDCSGNQIDLTKKVLIMRDYKTAKIYKERKIPLPDKLVELIMASLSEDPRSYVFTGRDGDKFSSNDSFAKWANRCLKKITKNDNINLTMLRHIYVNSLTGGQERVEAAAAMGHSVACQQTRYAWD